MHQLNGLTPYSGTALPFELHSGLALYNRMGWFPRHRRRLTAWLALAAMLFAHSALAVAACIVHADAGHASAPHEHGAGQAAHAHEHSGGQPAHTDESGHRESLLCQIGCEAQAQARAAPNTLEEPAPIAYKVAVLTPMLVGLVWPTRPVEAPTFYVSAAPPPLPLTILLSRFQK